MTSDLRPPATIKFGTDGWRAIIGEDYTFCDKYVAKYGQNVPVWSNFEFKHHGFQGNFWTYLNRLKDAGELLKHEDGVVTRVDGNVSSAA